MKSAPIPNGRQTKRPQIPKQTPEREGFGEAAAPPIAPSKSTRHVTILQDVLCFTVVLEKGIGFPINPGELRNTENSPESFLIRLPRNSPTRRPPSQSRGVGPLGSPRLRATLWKLFPERKPKLPKDGSRTSPAAPPSGPIFHWKF